MAGEIYAQLRHWAQAERSARQALAAAPRDAATHLAYAKLLARNVSTLLFICLIHRFAIVRVLLDHYKESNRLRLCKLGINVK